MTDSFFVTATAWSYGLALTCYVVLAARMALGWRRSARATLLLLAVIATAVWAAASIFAGLRPGPDTRLGLVASDALRYGAWFAFVWNLLRRDVAVDSDQPVTPARRRSVWLPVVVIGALVASVALAGMNFREALGLPVRFDIALRLALAIFGLALTEQLFRRTHAQARWAIKPLFLALAGLFGFELFFYADAMLFGRLDVDIWIARGVATALLIPFIAIATARNAGWTIEMHLSRGAVFHSTALLASGTFLLAVASAGYVVRYVGGEWGRALQIELVFAGLLFALLVASSGRFRARLKVFVSKHFFSYRYDYRTEWLRFTRTLSTDASSQNVQERTIMALADLVESPAGALWLKDEERGFVPASRWNAPTVDVIEPLDGSLARFLDRTGWVVSLPEYAEHPAHYPDLDLPPWVASFVSPWIIVPLVSGTELLGFVILGKPRAPLEVDWEVRDVLKTASRQAASYLGQIRATEALLEARKFDAFNRMSAFVVHDLKNLVAQLSLMLKNAERHRDNPEFQRDMLTTVQHVVGRMNGLMLQLRTGTTPVEKPRQVDLAPIVERVRSAKRSARTPIDVELAGVHAIGHEERLEHVIGHLVQNALDATSEHGRVTIRLSTHGRYASVEVEDNGSGMAPEFIRERLFKPFETTKHTGMGIGVYESAQYVKSIGGDIQVESVPGKGTTVRVLLPHGDSAATKSSAMSQAA